VLGQFACCGPVNLKKQKTKTSQAENHPLGDFSDWYMIYTRYVVVVSIWYTYTIVATWENMSYMKKSGRSWDQALAPVPATPRI
jgi:hypothetical protein